MQIVWWPSPRRVIPKIGLVIDMPDALHHFRDIMGHLGPDEADVVTIGEGDKVAASSLPKGWSRVSARELFGRRHAYRTLVSTAVLGHAGNLFWAKRSPHYVELLGMRNVRLMYSLAVGRSNYADWNRVYDAVLGFGPYDAERLAHLPGTRVFQVGYSRYDRYFGSSLKREAILDELGCDPSRKTVVWLPTYKDLSSIDLHADRVRTLEEKYNVILKPHPSTFTLEPERVRLLEKAGFKHLIRDNYDNLKLFKAADWVFSDHSGTAFGALYTDRNLLLLDVPGAADHPQVGHDSPDILIRSTLLHVAHDDPRPLEKFLEDDALWEKQKIERRRWRDRFFTPNYGNASQKAAEAILQVHRTAEPDPPRPVRKAFFAF